MARSALLLVWSHNGNVGNGKKRLGESSQSGRLEPVVIRHQNPQSARGWCFLSCSSRGKHQHESEQQDNRQSASGDGHSSLKQTMWDVRGPSLLSLPLHQLRETGPAWQ